MSEKGHARRGSPRFHLGLGAVVLLVTGLLACTPQTRYNVLSFFFDGVPDPNAPRESLERPRYDRRSPGRATSASLAVRPGSFSAGGFTTATQTSSAAFASFPPISGTGTKARSRALATDENAFHHAMDRRECLICHQSEFGLEPTVHVSADFCDQCHKEKRERDGKNHGPYRMTHCFPCHRGGHSSPYVEFREKPAAEQCLVCHKDDTKIQKTAAVQSAAKADDKATSPSYGSLPGLPGAALFEERRSSTTLLSMAHHKMEKEQCLVCHSEAEGLKPVVTITRDFCDKCHEEKRKSEGWNHASINVGDCQACHLGGHESPQPKLLRKPVADLCHFCHHVGKEKEMSLHVIKALRIDVNVCTACHDPHKVF